MTLARTVAHTVHVDAMLSSLEPGQFDEWMAMYAIQPWGLEPHLEREEKPTIEDSLNLMRRQTGV